MKGNKRNPGYTYPPGDPHQYYPGGYTMPPYLPGGPYQPPQVPPPEKPTIWKRLGLAGWSLLLLMPLFILVALFLVILFVGRPYVVNGSSMEPTLHTGDRVFVVKYRLNTTPDRDDVVVLRDVAGSPEMLIKRIIAIAGDKISVQKDRIVVNDKYEHRSTNQGASTPYTRLVPDGQVFVMGDNESHSYDSRVFGPVSMKKVMGKAVVIFWPFNDLKFL